MRRDQDLLSGAALTAFKLNGLFLDLAERLARPAGLTATWWQVLGAALHTPLPVASIAREMGISRQAVQRTADVLVGNGMAEYRDNPAHRRAKLVAVTPEGLAAVHAINPQHAVAARKLVDALGGKDQGADELAGTITAMTKLCEAVEVLLSEVDKPS